MSSSSNIPPNPPPSSHGVSGSSQTPPASPPSENPFIKLLPGATPQELTQITNNFINFTVQQMKQDQDNMLQALKQMQDDINDN